MKLDQKLANEIGAKLVNATSDLTFSNIELDSRNVKPGTLFIAISGYKQDGHEYIESAFMQGAVGVIVEKPEFLKDRPGIIVKNSRQALSKLANIFYGKPSSQMQIVGITGTKGKTTINWMIFQLLNLMGKKTARFGTLGIFAENLINTEADLTSHDAITLHKNLKLAHDAGFKSAIVEVASHAMSQYRSTDVSYDLSVFTNLTPDHLDYYKDLEEYFQAKKILIDLTLNGDKKGKLVINYSDDYGQRLLKEYAKVRDKIITYGFEPGADLYLKNGTSDFSGSKLKIAYQNKDYEFNMNFIGKFNYSNALAALASCISLGYKLEDLVSIFNKIPGVPGRLEFVGNDQLGIYVDYAHNGDSVAKALQALRELPLNKLWVLFGCGGGKDPGKRRTMSIAAMENADRITVTSDNPRLEDPKNIINDILSTGIKPDIIEEDRSLAIKKTINMAKPGDVILLAGKGHETSQIYGTVKHYFSDQAEARKFLKERYP